MYRYELIIYWSEDDERYLVEVPELPGCMADGITYEEAVHNAQKIILEWIEILDTSEEAKESISKVKIWKM